MGEAFDVGPEARAIADDHPEVAFLMGDSARPHGSNYAVFDNYIHEPCYLMGVLAGAMTKSNRIGMVGGYSIGEVNRLFNAFMAGARWSNPEVRFKVAFINSWYDPAKAKGVRPGAGRGRGRCAVCRTRRRRRGGAGKRKSSPSAASTT